MISAGFGSVVDARAMETMHEFIDTATHELRTPLTSLKGVLEIMSGIHKTKLPPDVQKLLNIALQGRNRLMLLINDLLTVSKMNAGEMFFNMADENLDNLLEDALESIAQYREDISFVQQHSLPGVRVRVDRNRFLQIMANLLSNAAKFSKENEKVFLSSTAADGKVTISVKDNGVGMPKSFHSQVFRKFAQAQKNQGSGLGLHITKDFVDKMNGRIWFESEEGKGTTFFVEFPILN